MRLLLSDVSRAKRSTRDAELARTRRIHGILTIAEDKSMQTTHDMMHYLHHLASVRRRGSLPDAPFNLDHARLPEPASDQEQP
jgi:hypothetical protein